MRTSETLPSSPTHMRTTAASLIPARSNDGGSFTRYSSAFGSMRSWPFATRPEIMRPAAGGPAAGAAFSAPGEAAGLAPLVGFTAPPATGPPAAPPVVSPRLLPSPPAGGSRRASPAGPAAVEAAPPGASAGPAPPGAGLSAAAIAPARAPAPAPAPAGVVAARAPGAGGRVA